MTVVAVALIAACASVISAAISAFALIQSRDTHALINSRMTELLRAETGKAHAEGVASGEQAQRDRDATPKEAP